MPHSITTGTNVRGGQANVRVWCRVLLKRDSIRCCLWGSEFFLVVVSWHTWRTARTSVPRDTFNPWKGRQGTDNSKNEFPQDEIKDHFEAVAKRLAFRCGLTNAGTAMLESYQLQTSSFTSVLPLLPFALSRPFVSLINMWLILLMIRVLDFSYNRWVVFLLDPVNWFCDFLTVMAILFRILYYYIMNIIVWTVFF